MNQYNSLLVSALSKNWWNPFWKQPPPPRVVFPNNVTFTDVHVGNLFYDVTLLNVSVFSDADPERKFRKIFENFIIKPNETHSLEVELECFEYLIFKVETLEGFHSKTISCLETDFTETFVTRMSSLVDKVSIATDYT